MHNRVHDRLWFFVTAGSVRFEFYVRCWLSSFSSVWFPSLITMGVTRDIFAISADLSLMSKQRCWIFVSFATGLLCNSIRLSPLCCCRAAHGSADRWRIHIRRSSKIGGLHCTHRQTLKMQLFLCVCVLFSEHTLMIFINSLTLWRSLLPYGYSYKASCARPG